MVAAPIIALNDVVFRWQRGGDPCLDIRQLHIKTGERVFLHGESGSGKSTLLGLLGGVLTPERGTIKVLDTDLTTLSGAARDRFRADHVGFLFQQFNLIPYLSVVDNILLPCRFSARRRMRAIAEKRSLHEQAFHLLGKLDLSPSLWRREVTKLSVGQQQRVAAARALIGRPEILIADEPASALDADRQRAFLDLVLSECLATNATVVFASHDRRLAPSFSREAAIAEINRNESEREAA